MLRDIVRDTPQVRALRQVMGAAAADILVLGAVDYDAEGRALAALNAGLDRPYPHLLALPGNAGLDTGLDLDGDGAAGGPRDMQAYGRFAGEAGMAILSRRPVAGDRAVSLNALLWRDLPGSLLVDRQGRTGAAARGAGVQRLSSGGHWIVPVETGPGTWLTLLAFHATAPVFDGPEDRNGRRNHDEMALWRHLLDGALAVPPPIGAFVIAGTANVDPAAGEGRRAALDGLLADPRLQDPAPRSSGGALAPSGGQAGDPALDTVDWAEPAPGNLRVDYLLPAAALRVTGSGVLWPAPDDPLAAPVIAASRHRLVWVEIEP